MNKDAFLPDDFEQVPPVCAGERVQNLPPPSPSFARETVALLRKNKVAMLSLSVLLLLVLGAVIIPMVWPVDFAAQRVAFANKPFFSRDPVSGLFHVFGTDYLGRDIFVRIWYGARVSLLVAGVVAVIDCVVGVIYGSISGYLGGAVDTVMMRLVEIIKAVPYLVVVLLLMAMLPQGVGTLIVAYTLVGWTGMARLVRGQTASLAGSDFIVAAKIMGAGPKRLMLRHLVPNMMGVIIVNLTLDIPGIIFTEAFLSMLGLGVPPPVPSLGTMVNEGAAVFQTYPARLAVPALFICLVMLAFNLLGDQLQDTLNPKLRRRADRGRDTNY